MVVDGHVPTFWLLLHGFSILRDLVCKLTERPLVLNPQFRVCLGGVWGFVSCLLASVFGRLLAVF